MTYEALRAFAGSWGLVFLMLMFFVAVAYALWPGNRDKFRQASRAPLDDDGQGDG